MLPGFSQEIVRTLHRILRSGHNRRAGAGIRNTLGHGPHEDGILRSSEIEVLEAVNVKLDQLLQVAPKCVAWRWSVNLHLEELMKSENSSQCCCDNPPIQAELYTENWSSPKTDTLGIGIIVQSFTICGDSQSRKRWRFRANCDADFTP